MGSWKADYPDGDNFTQLLYRAHICKSNSARIVYRQSLRTPDGPQRDALYPRMAGLLSNSHLVVGSHSSYNTILVQRHVSESSYMDIADVK